MWRSIDAANVTCRPGDRARNRASLDPLQASLRVRFKVTPVLKTTDEAEHQVLVGNGAKALLSMVPAPGQWLTW